MAGAGFGLFDHDPAVVFLAGLGIVSLFAQYDLACVRLLRGDAGLAADLRVAAAQRGVGCDQEAPLGVRLEQTAAGLKDALRRSGQEADAAALAVRAPR